jgi:type VI protein secretion system component VasF
MDRWLKVKKAKSPDLINWENLNTSRTERCGRYVITTFLSFFLVALTLIFLLVANAYQEKIKNTTAYSTGACPID